MDNFKIKKIQKGFYKTSCPYCNKEIRGLSEGQVRSNTLSHINNCPKKKEVD